MALKFQYSFKNTDHIPQRLLSDVEDALLKRAYVCQQEFEKALDLYHEINILEGEAVNGEARVIAIEIEDGECHVTLDFSSITYYPEDDPYNKGED